MGDVRESGRFRIFPISSVSETSSSFGIVHPQVSFYGERLAALHLTSNSEPLQRTGHCVDRRFVLIYLRAPALKQILSWRAATSTASEQGHLTAAHSSITMKYLPMPTTLLRVRHGVSLLVSPEGMPWLLPPVDFYSEPWRILWSRSHPSGRPVRGGVLSPVACPAKQCEPRGDLDSPACPTSAGLCAN